MKEASSDKIFKPRARLLLQLGDQLIRSDIIAVVELVKNAYDADAERCDVLLKNVDQKDSAEILIKDNGMGMTPEIVKNVWLEPGADAKEMILDGKKLPEDFGYTAKRLPIGEKGIGRFGVHKLGNYIELVTKNKKSAKEVVVKIDWDTFRGVKYLDEAKFLVEERKPEIFTKGKTGTHIYIKKVNKVWTERLYRELHRSVVSLNSPFNKKDNFEVNLGLNLSNRKTQAQWNKDLLTVGDFKSKALWKLDCTVSGNEITDFTYEFRPWKTMDKLNAHKITTKSKEYQKAFQKFKDNEKTLDLGLFKVGEIKIEAYLFDLSPKILNLSLENMESLNEFLGHNGGVRVYRDGMRVYDYGEPGNDWLNLDKTRINQPSQKIGNRNILAAVQLKRSDSRDLNEKTNREGFVEDEAYFLFRDSVKRVIEIFGQLRNIDKEEIRRFYGGSAKTQPVLHDIEELREAVDVQLKGLSHENKSPSEFKKEKELIKKEIFSSLEKIEKEYINTNKILLKSAGAGLSLGVVIHEIEKRIKELTQVLTVADDEFNLGKTRTLVKSIAKLVENYTVLLSSEKKTSTDLASVINDAIFNTEFRLKAHKIELTKAFEKQKQIRVNCSPNTIVGVVLNIFDNSIFWLGFNEIEKKKLYVDIQKHDKTSVSVIIADNGKGFALSSENAVQPFVTLKPGGMGLGLHIVNEMMKASGGKLLIRDFKEVSGIPKEFSGGAIVELIFQKKNETK